jgi:hypothetical protein
MDTGGLSTVAGYHTLPLRGYGMSARRHGFRLARSTQHRCDRTFARSVHPHRRSVLDTVSSYVTRLLLVVRMRPDTPCSSKSSLDLLKDIVYVLGQSCRRAGKHEGCWFAGPIQEAFTSHSWIRECLNGLIISTLGRVCMVLVEV